MLPQHVVGKARGPIIIGSTNYALVMCISDVSAHDNSAQLLGTAMNHSMTVILNEIASAQFASVKYTE